MTSYSKHIKSDVSVQILYENQCGYALVGRAQRHTVVVVCVHVCVSAENFPNTLVL